MSQQSAVFWSLQVISAAVSPLCSDRKLLLSLVIKSNPWTNTCLASKFIKKLAILVFSVSTFLLMPYLILKCWPGTKIFKIFNTFIELLWHEPTTKKSLYTECILHMVEWCCRIVKYELSHSCMTWIFRVE